MLISIAFATTAQAQTEQRLSIDEMFRMIDKRNSSIKADRTAVEAAGEGIKAARSQRLPDISTQLNFSYIGNALLTDRDFGNGVSLGAECAAVDAYERCLFHAAKLVIVSQIVKFWRIFITLSPRNSE